MSKFSNVPSLLLSPDENDAVFSLLAKKCVTQNTSVVQLYRSLPDPLKWRKHFTGVLCYVKDSSQKSYFLRLYCLIRNMMIWEHEMYTGIEFSNPTPFLVTFEGDNHIIALNFAHAAEVEVFLSVVERKRRTKNPKTKIKSEAPKLAATAVVSTKAKTSTEKRKRFNKDDIGAPTDFKHIQHFSFGKWAEEVIEMAHVSEKQIEDHKEFIDNFIKTYEPNLNPVVPDQAYLPSPAAPPTYSNQPPMKNRPLPALPRGPRMPSNPAPPPPTTARPSIPARPRQATTALVRPSPPPPQMITTTSNAPIPPPPQPMPLDIIAQGKNPNHEMRNTLLDEIHGGKILKRVTERKSEVEKPVVKDTNTLANLLQKALQNRDRAMHESSDEETCENPYDDEEWDD